MTGTQRLVPLIRPEQIAKFRIGDFPKGEEERRAFLFRHTGYTAQIMSAHEWYCLNYSINQGLDLGLPTDGSDRTLKILSLIDHSLSEVPRFVGVSYMPPMRADSTAGHSKQVMNVVQTVFENAGILKRPQTEQLRRDALIGAWIHDMGETIFEMTTASDMFLMRPEDAAATSKEKDALEHEIFEFCCQLAGQCADSGRDADFHDAIKQLRDVALTARAQFPGDDQQRARITAQMTAIKQGMAQLREQHGIPTEPYPETTRLMDIYDRTEIAAPGNFLHPLVKSLESVEGQRYLQRNAAVHEIDRLGRSLARPGEYPRHAELELSNDHEVIQGITRVERRLPMLFETAKTSFEKEIAKSAARFIYGSVARQFLPDPTGNLGVVPAVIDRQPVRPIENPHQIPLDDLERIRSQELEYKRQQLATQDPDDYNARYMARERLHAVYRAAQSQVGRGFFPQTPSLASLVHTPHMPGLLQREARKVELDLQQRSSGGNVDPWRGRA